ncbi:putative AC transposase [Hypsizygus marmoreus]|uniref:AC transposase n=1 Tax=Hypsizygus marmoreus TaxID=39966 RepID=A0A369JNB7_HYPMA|nr:putative AC transposase [Hypsizygus marmoreus]
MGRGQGKAKSTAGKASTSSAPTTRSTRSRKTVAMQAQKRTAPKRGKAANDHDDDELSSSSSDEEPRCRHWKKRQHRREEEDDVEVVDGDEPAAEGSELEVVRAGEDSGEESEAGDNDNTNGLEARHNIPIPSARPVKKDSSKDILLVMSDRVKVRFMHTNNHSEVLQGQWCTVCKNDESFIAANGRRKAFHMGGNSSCRQHIHQHYELYKTKCEESEVPENHWAIPRPIWKQMEEEKNAKKKKIQTTLEFEILSSPKEFTRDGILQAVTELIAVDDQALALANKAVFHNCLVTMRPKTTKADLPSTHNVVVHLHNQFVEWLKQLKADILKAPGKVSVTADGWSADTTKASFLGMMAHWIDVVKGKSEVIAFQGILGDHSGLNLGRYFVGCCDRVGIMGKDGSKCATLDNTSSNTTLTETVEDIHIRRQLEWNSKENQLPCCGHVINLANVDIMACITKIGAIENATAIWEYDPTLPDNRMLGGSLNVITALRTLAIKMQSFGQRIEYFEKCQIQCGQKETYKIPLHSNIRWGTAHEMLNKSQLLRQDSNRIQQAFSSEREPTLWRVLPALEELQTEWEKKKDDIHYILYEDALEAGLTKLKKYYLLLDQKPGFVLTLTLHPYYKLAYISHAWGGEKEQAEEIAAGNKNAKNWQDEALQIVERTMWHYWLIRPRAPIQPTQTSTTSASTTPASTTPSDHDSTHRLSEFDRHRQSLLTREDQEGWQAELRRYLKDIPADVTKDTNIVEWWQNHCQLYPTLARIALDILPCQVSSVPCERLFSGSKQTADYRCAKLGAKIFEELQLMKFAWRNNVKDLAALNSSAIEEIDIITYTDLLDMDQQFAEWDIEADEIVA